MLLSLPPIDLPGWATLVKDLGFPIAIALILMGGTGVLFYAGLRAAKWFGSEIVVPLRDAHTNVLKGMETSMVKQGATLEGVKDTLEKLTLLQEQHGAETSYIRKLMEGKNEQPK